MYMWLLWKRKMRLEMKTKALYFVLMLSTWKRDEFSFFRSIIVNCPSLDGFFFGFFFSLWQVHVWLYDFSILFWLFVLYLIWCQFSFSAGWYCYGSTWCIHSLQIWRRFGCNQRLTCWSRANRIHCYWFSDISNRFLWMLWRHIRIRMHDPNCKYTNKFLLYINKYLHNYHQ